MVTISGVNTTLTNNEDNLCYTIHIIKKVKKLLLKTEF